MSERLPKITSTELLRIAHKLRFILNRQTGSHAVLYKREKKQLWRQMHF